MCTVLLFSFMHRISVDRECLLVLCAESNVKIHFRNGLPYIIISCACCNEIWELWWESSIMQSFHCLKNNSLCFNLLFTPPPTFAKTRLHKFPPCWVSVVTMANICSPWCWLINNLEVCDPPTQNESHGYLFTFGVHNNNNNNEEL